MGKGKKLEALDESAQAFSRQQRGSPLSPPGLNENDDPGDAGCNYDPGLGVGDVDVLLQLMQCLGHDRLKKGMKDDKTRVLGGF